MRHLGQILVVTAALAVPASASAATFDVNDDNTGSGPAGANCAGADFTTIQGAVNAAAASGDGVNDTILVCAGTYDELVAINANDGLDLLGPQQGVDARSRSVPAGDEAAITDAGSGDGTIAIGADDVLVDGFLVEDEGGNIPSGAINVSPPAGGHQLLNNILRDNVLGIRLCNTAASPALVRHNLLQDNNAAGPGSGTGIISDCPLADTVIEQNAFTGHDADAIRFTIAGSNVEFADNELTADASLDVRNMTAMTIEGNTVTDSTASIVSLGGGNDEISVEGNSFSGGDFTSIQVQDLGLGDNTNLSVTGNTLLGDPVETSDRALFAAAGSLDGDLEAHFNRIAGNSTGVENEDVDDAVNAENNWWGCNEGPGMPGLGCDNVIGEIDFDPWLVLGITASPTAIPAGSGSSQLSASVTRNSSGAVVGPGFPDQTQIGFSTSLGSIGSSALTSGGVAASTLSAGSTPGTAIVSGGLDSESAVTAVAITEAAAAPVPPKKKCKKKSKKKRCKKKGKKAKKK